MNNPWTLSEVQYVPVVLFSASVGGRATLPGANGGCGVGKRSAGLNDELLTVRRVGDAVEVRLYVSKLEIRVGGALQAYETAQRQPDGRLQSRNEGLCGGMRKGPVCSAVSGPAVQGRSVSEKANE